MASKYGNKKYGMNLYSSALMLLDGGTISVPVTISGRLGKIILTLEGNVSTQFADSARLTAFRPFSSNLVFATTYSGDLEEFVGYRGNVVVSFTLRGELFRAAEREFEAVLPISVSLEGRFGLSRPLQGVAINIPMTIGGGDVIYIGPFWDPDDPIFGPWVPDIPDSGFWVPDSPKTGPWIPVAPVGNFNG